MSNVGYQTNVVFESASSSALEFLAHNIFYFIYLFCAHLFIYFAHNLFIYSFCVVIKYFIRAYDKVNSVSFLLQMVSSLFTLDDIYNINQH